MKGSEVNDGGIVTGVRLLLTGDRLVGESAAPRPQLTTGN